uniref:Uncharacterized protein n=1 Tax=Vespula pensylvanica TaxID=30213 RepID=A0A834NHB3_VESPE|nr:hypothetical protein H0235_013937 [Vespula pensylvanica]
MLSCTIMENVANRMLVNHENDGKRIASSDRVRIIDRRPVSWPRNRERDESCSRPSSPRVKDEEEKDEEEEEEDEEDEEDDDATTIGSAFRDLSRALSASHFFFPKLSAWQASRQAGRQANCWLTGRRAS